MRSCHAICVPLPCHTAESPNISQGCVHTYQDILNLRIRLPSTRIRCIQQTNPPLFESSLQSGDFLIPYVSRNVLTDRLVLYREYWIFKTVRAKKKLRIQKYPDTCERANSFCIRIRVDVEIFVSGKKKLSVQKYPDACGWRLRKTTKNVWQKTNKQTMIRIVVDLGQKRLDQSRTKPRLALVLDALPYLIKWEPLVIHFTFTSFEGLDQGPSTPPPPLT